MMYGRNHQQHHPSGGGGQLPLSRGDGAEEDDPSGKDKGRRRRRRGGPLSSTSSSALRIYLGIAVAVALGIYVLMDGGGGVVNRKASSPSAEGGGIDGSESVAKSAARKKEAADEAFSAADADFSSYLEQMDRIESDERRAASANVAEARLAREKVLAAEKEREALEAAAAAAKLAEEARAAEEAAKAKIEAARRAEEEAEEAKRAAAEEEALTEKFAVDAKERKEERERAKRAAEEKAAAEAARKGEAKLPRRGFVVLGMHRSGTSMLSGLLVTGMGYNVGGPLIGPAFDNAKGFFERIDVVLQNDAFMNNQHVDWSANVMKYDAQRALDQLKEEKIKFKEGEKALAFLNDPSKKPWLQKDPRMCITLPTWLDLLDSEPAVVFTYRHPLEVANSLKKREKGFPLERGLRLWIAYNIRAIENSADLCRVVSSNDALLADPLREVQRISDEITDTCGVPAPPRKLDQATVDKFVDPTLQHNKKRNTVAEENPPLAKHGDCVVSDYESEHPKGTPQRDREEGLYLKAMKLYCDLRSGEAYKSGYEWPAL